MAKMALSFFSFYNLDQFLSWANLTFSKVELRVSSKSLSSVLVNELKLGALPLKVSTYFYKFLTLTYLALAS